MASPARFPKLETRSGLVELRATAQGRRLDGYATLYNVETPIADLFTEIVRPDAFRQTLDGGDDVLALVGHSVDALLARRSSGTLRLGSDTRGLSFDITLADTSLGRDTLAMVERRDLTGCSIGFRIRPSGEAWAGSKRTLSAVELVELSIVPMPAVAGTSVEARTRCQGELSRARSRMIESI
ncbi:MAG: HK97 family phage prohead protease [Janthinobacterium lividum]